MPLFEPTDELVPAAAVIAAADGQTLVPPTFFTLQRADDMLDLAVQLSGFTLHVTTKGAVLRTLAGGTITLTLPLQQLLEASVTQPSQPVFGGASVLRFKVPPNAPDIPLSAEGILAAVADCELLVDSAFGGAPLIEDTGGVTPFASNVALGPIGASQSITQVVLPGRLGLTPRGGAMRWRHAARPVAHGGMVELWHTRLARLGRSGRYHERSEDIVGTQRVFTPLHTTVGGGSPQDPTPVVVPNPNSAWNLAAKAVLRLDDNQVNTIVSQSRQAPGSLKARQLMLSPLGAWADLRGRWPGKPISSWRHEMAMGRDQSSRLLVVGLMYPLGHAAVMDVTTERVLDGKNGRLALLIQRTKFTITEDTVRFNGDDAVTRSFPFREVEVLSVAPPAGSAAQIVTGAFVLERGSTSPKRPFLYRCRGIDKAGRTVHFQMPLAFVAANFNNYADLAAEWNELSDLANSNYIARLDGQRVALATPTSRSDDAGTEVVLDLAKLGHGSGGAAGGFRPVLRSMSGWVPGIEEFGNDAKALTMSYASAFVNGAKEFADDNLGELLLQIDGAPALALADARSVSGMLSELKMQPVGWSRRLGPVAGSLASAFTARFEPAALLGDALKTSKLLGIFPIETLLSAVQGVEQAPRILARTVNGARHQSFRWSAPLFANGKPVDAFLGRLRAANGKKAQITVQGVATVDLQSQQLHASTVCSIDNVEAAIIVAGAEFVTVPFESIKFSAANGQAPDVKVALGQIGFGGALRYLHTLVKLVDRAGFLNANGIELLPDGVRTSFQLPVPGFAIGIFVLENISFGARFELPFKDRVPKLDLNFSCFENPFTLTVLAIGGRGYVQLGLDMKGELSLAAALEFGAAVSLNLGIAKASVSIMGGIHFVIDNGDWTITGYLRVNGRCEILGIASVSLELYVGLTYIPHENAVLGEAQIVATVRVLFAKKTFRVPFKKRFAGPSIDEARVAGAAAQAALSGPPGFQMAMDPPGFQGERPWDTHCMAYAE